MNIRKYILFTLLFFFPLVAFSELTEEQLALLEKLPPDQRESVMEKMELTNDLTEEIEEVFEEENSLIERPEKVLDPEDICEECIYGYEIFKWSPTSFAANTNMPVPETYIVGPGDQLYIEYFGTEETTEEVFISREGTISLPSIGPIDVSGLTFLELKKLIQQKVSKNLIGTSAAVTLIQLRLLKSTF